MGIWSWLFGKRDVQRYVITTENGSTYPIERKQGLWYLDRGVRGIAQILQIGKKQAKNVPQLTYANKGDIIVFINQRGTNGYTTIRTVAKLE